MEDTNSFRSILSSERPPSTEKGHALLGAYRLLPRLTMLLFLAAMLSSFAGCSLFVMGGKMLFGNPKVPAPFTTQTGDDLSKTGHKVLVVCTMPESVKAESPSADYDLLIGVTRRLKRNEIKVVNPDDVASWLDSHGGYWDDPTELANEFDAEYIVHIDLEDFTFREENSPDLFRGRTHGVVHAFKVTEVDGRKTTSEVFSPEYSSVYPEQVPIASGRLSAKVFHRKFLERVCDQISQLFYHHHFSDKVH